MQKIVWKYKEVILTKRIEGHLYHFPYCSIGAPYTLFYSNKCMCGEEAPESLIKLRDFMNQMNGNWNLVIKYRQADKQTDNGWWRRATGRAWPTWAASQHLTSDTGMQIV